MKKLIAIAIAIFLFIAGTPIPTSSKEKRHHKHHHKNREKINKWDSGHTEFKDRTKKERRQLSRHHIKP